MPGVSAFSFDVLSLFGSGDASITVYDPSSTLLESYTLTGVPNTGSGIFGGVTTANDGTIGSVVLTIAGEYAGVDRVQIGKAAPVPIPEPGTFSLLGTALVGLSGVMRRKLRA